MSSCVGPLFMTSSLAWSLMSFCCAASSELCSWVSCAAWVPLTIESSLAWSAFSFCWADTSVLCAPACCDWNVPFLSESSLAWSASSFSLAVVSAALRRDLLRGDRAVLFGGRAWPGRSSVFPGPRPDVLCSVRLGGRRAAVQQLRAAGPGPKRAAESGRGDGRVGGGLGRDRTASRSCGYRAVDRARTAAATDHCRRWRRQPVLWSGCRAPVLVELAESTDACAAGNERSRRLNLRIGRTICLVDAPPARR